MLKKEDLQKTPEYWLEIIQNELYDQVIEFMEQNQINQTELAEKLKVSKGYVSQILKGQFNYTLKKLIELSLAIGKVPNIQFEKFEEFTRKEKHGKDSNSYVIIYSSTNINQTRRFDHGNTYIKYPVNLNAKRSIGEKYELGKHKLIEHKFNQKKPLINF